VTKKKQRWFDKLESDPLDLYRDAAKGAFLALVAALLWIAAIVGLAAVFLTGPADPPPSNPT